MKAVLWFAIGLYGWPLVVKYVGVIRDRGLNA